MWRSGTTLAALLIVGTALYGTAALAQQGGGMIGGSPDAGAIVSKPDITPDQREFRDKALLGKAPRTKSLVPKPQALDEAAELLTKLRVPCKLNDASLVAMGPVDIGGRKIDTKTFEVSCDSGLGYFVVSAENADVFSCFAADATRAKDIAEGKEPGIVCTLPANADPKAMATAVLAHSGVNCQVSRVRWIGLSAKASTEYTEAACSDGTGYVLTSAVPGSSSPVGAMPCVEAGKRGILCTMSSNGQPAITIRTFKDELARHKIACSASDENIHVIGQETAQKRYVVEFKCSDFPKGLVAYIPLGDNKMSFETTDCATAAKRHVMCTLQ